MFSTPFKVFSNFFTFWAENTDYLLYLNTKVYFTSDHVNVIQDRSNILKIVFRIVCM